MVINIIACTPRMHSAGAPVSPGQLLPDLYITKDGAQLPVKSWLPKQGEVKSVIIALHGFNDYSNFFHQPGLYLSKKNSASYAYDQRGFGGSPYPGSWAGVDTYIDDLETFVRLVKNKHPDSPVFILGESMGGAVVISTMAQANSLPVKGLILVAPAVWGRNTMPWYQTTLLWTLSHTMPWLTLTGEGLNIKPSDNIEMLRTLGRDPLVIKETRVESIYGLVNLMDQALASADLITTNTLLLYGEKDEIIPKEPTFHFLHHLNDKKIDHSLIAFYKDGYHMLLRDLQAAVLWDDINAWINSFSANLPSGADKRAQELLNNNKQEQILSISKYK